MLHHLPGCRVFTTCCSHGRAGGTAFVLSPEFASYFDTIHMDVVVRGRICILRCRKDDGLSLVIANVHIFHEGLSAAVMHRYLREALSSSDSCCTCVVGDFNDVAPEEGRLDMKTGALRF